MPVEWTDKYKVIAFAQKQGNYAVIDAGTHYQLVKPEHVPAHIKPVYNP